MIMSINRFTSAWNSKDSDEDASASSWSADRAAESCAKAVIEDPAGGKGSREREWVGRGER